MAGEKGVLNHGSNWQKIFHSSSLAFQKFLKSCSLSITRPKFIRDGCYIQTTSFFAFTAFSGTYLPSAYSLIFTISYTGCSRATGPIYLALWRSSILFTLSCLPLLCQKK
mmetsp:Transcript_4174/g.15746  ORF Transcript_4174/g.15746 Transcript_4174/m.15746 type:complete len:110 (+) Transcript_4174:132-461(+)